MANQEFTLGQSIRLAPSSRAKIQTVSDRRGDHAKKIKGFSRELTFHISVTLVFKLITVVDNFIPEGLKVLVKQ